MEIKNHWKQQYLRLHPFLPRNIWINGLNKVVMYKNCGLKRIYSPIIQTSKTHVKVYIYESVELSEKR